MSNRRKPRDPQWMRAPSSRRSSAHACDVCGRDAEVESMTFDNDGTVHVRRWLCRTHAVDMARTFRGTLWRDPECTCGCVDDILGEAGRA